MTRTSIVISSLSAMLLGTAVLAQAPLSEIDTHIATAKTAAGQDYRGTFVNLCLPSAPPAAAPAGALEAARREALARTTDAGPGQLVRTAPEGVRQPLLAGNASAFLVGAADERRAHHHRHEFRLGHAARDHRWA